MRPTRLICAAAAATVSACLIGPFCRREVKNDASVALVDNIKLDGVITAVVDVIFHGTANVEFTLRHRSDTTCRHSYFLGTGRTQLPPTPYDYGSCKAER